MSNDNYPIRNLILDMDGVLWHGDRPVPGLVDFFQQLIRLNIGYVLATNNARKVASQYSDKLAGFGVVVPSEQILTSAEVAADYLQHLHPSGARVYAVGDVGLRLALVDHGFDLLEGDGFVGEGARADIVVVGFTPYFCYDHMASATYLINHGASFVGTNPDTTFPTEYGPLPGAGSMLSFLETATDVKPIVLGKPGTAMFDQALRMLNGTRNDTVMVGDRLETDIKGAHSAGLRSVLLLSGISDIDEVTRSDVKPNWIMDDLGQLADYLRSQDVKG